MKIGIKLIEVKKGGKFENEFYDNVIVLDKPIERKGEYVIIDIPNIPFAWLNTNKADIKFEPMALYVEAPASFKTVDVPNWLPEFEYADDDGNMINHTFESWGISRERLDGTKILIDLTAQGNGVVTSAMITKILGISNVTPLTASQARTLVQGPEYSTPEL